MLTLEDAQTKQEMQEDNWMLMLLGMLGENWVLGAPHKEETMPKLLGRGAWAHHRSRHRQNQGMKQEDQTSKMQDQEGKRLRKR